MGQLSNDILRRGTAGGSRRLVPAITTIAMAIGLGLLLTQLGHTAAAMMLVAVGAVAIAILSPYWALVIAVVQWAFIPSEGAFLSIEVTPNQLQFIGPLLVVAALLRSLKDRAHDRLQPRLSDLAVISMGLWGYVGLLLNGHLNYKWYTNRMVLPMLFYYATRLIRLTHKRVRTLLATALGAVGLQSLLMIRESRVGSSRIYRVRPGLVDGARAAHGPFLYHWNAGIFMSMWPHLFIYMIANSSGRGRKFLWGLGLMAVLIAATRTMQRAATLASLLAIALCLLPSRLRRTTVAIVAILAIAYIPWSAGSTGGALMDRFDQTDQSRLARRTVALNLLQSDRWNPVYGLGWSRGYWAAEGLGTDEEIVAWGDRRRTIADLEQSPLHNVWLQIPVEFGIVGSLLAISIMLSAFMATARILRRARERPVDLGLLTVLWGSLIAVGAVGYFQHIWHMPAAMSVMWMIYGIIVTQPHAFDIDEAEVADSEQSEPAPTDRHPRRGRYGMAGRSR